MPYTKKKGGMMGEESIPTTGPSIKENVSTKADILEKRLSADNIIPMMSEEMSDMMIGGKDGKRHFRVIDLNGKKVSFGQASITQKASPSDAASKLLKSIAHDYGFSKNDKIKVGKVTFIIQEFTRGSKHKRYGPYIGYYRKYTSKELNKAKTANGKQGFTMKPVVKLA